MQYERRPYPVEAFQYTGENLEAFRDWITGVTDLRGVTLVESVALGGQGDARVIHRFWDRQNFSVKSQYWVVLDGDDFEVYGPTHFQLVFREVE